MLALGVGPVDGKTIDADAGDVDDIGVSSVPGQLFVALIVYVYECPAMPLASLNVVDAIPVAINCASR